MVEKEIVYIGVDHPNFIIRTLRELGEELGYQLQISPKALNAANEWDNIFVTFRGKENQGQFHIQQMPGCCAVLIGSYIRVHPHSQKAFDETVNLIELAARRAGFGSVMLTQTIPESGDTIDEPWAWILSRDWVMSPAFRNAKSGNLVVYLTKDLQQEGKKAGFEFKVRGAEAEL